MSFSSFSYFFNPFITKLVSSSARYSPFFRSDFTPAYTLEMASSSARHSSSQAFLLAAAVERAVLSQTDSLLSLNLMMSSLMSVSLSRLIRLSLRRSLR